ncbi:hypothetical protein CFB84_36760 [Burkholderia aenigmatica]|uniref:Uncharacterized protein n=1 Tax=Burkholderia aenigmatica TaxID=2015348 RepID=A0A228I0I0_9BURK|nr:hypothetical protein CFB84_36760 [Burkholderia aenigmatica]
MFSILLNDVYFVRIVSIHSPIEVEHCVIVILLRRVTRPSVVLVVRGTQSFIQPHTDQHDASGNHGERDGDTTMKYPLYPADWREADNKNK